MGLTFLLTAAGFIVVFVQMGTFTPVSVNIKYKVYKIIQHSVEFGCILVPFVKDFHPILIPVNLCCIFYPRMYIQF